MRAVGLLLLLLLPCCAFAQQPAAAQSPRLAYSETQTLGGVTQAELVTRMQDWAHRHSRDLQAEPVAAPDQALTVQGSEDVVYPQQGVAISRPLHYALTLTVHENSYRYQLTELALGPVGQPQVPEAAYQPVEPLLAPAPGQESTQAYLLRTAIEEAIAQLLGGLQYDLAHAVPVAHEDN